MDSLVFGSNLTEAQSLSGVCCLALLALLGDKVSFPGTQGYNSSVSSYFSQQESQVRPSCIVTPRTSEDVSVAVRSLSSTSGSLGIEEQASCRFAIRSGGHGLYAGTANIENGVTIDLRSLNNVETSEDKSTAYVGVGATWGDVYSKLDPLGLSVAGGRAAQVGVGGLTVGGGISYYSPRYGWTCDTVSNFEVVLANGSIVNANSEENPDLLFALRGGSNNFGVVTRTDFQAFEQGPVWGGVVYYDTSTLDEQLKAFVDFNSADSYDEYASLITNFGFAAGHGAVILNNLEYTKAEENPAVFQPFTRIPSLSNTLRMANMTDIATEQGSFSPNGLRQLFVVTTYKSTVPMLNTTYISWNKSLAAIQDIPNIIWSISLEPLPPAFYARSALSNAFGLSDRSGSLVIALLTAMWMNEDDDERIETTARELYTEIEDDAKKSGAYDPFVYLNYAAPWQDPIASYGAKNVERLKRVRKGVDSRGVFTRQVPGGFKIPT
ncbi:putative oxidoreductase [Hypomontagnella monticulosa]|nr:putative oxidoreductase [Hypomontagnella monticulosa]